MPTVLSDAGPLVALLDRREQWHQWAVDAIGAVDGPVHTCEPVLAEAAYLLRGLPGAADDLLRFVERGLLRVEFQVGPEIPSLRVLMKRYRSVPMSLADACLVRMSEQVPNATVVTLDSDFSIYRRHGRSVIPALMPY